MPSIAAFTGAWPRWVWTVLKAIISSIIIGFIVDKLLTDQYSLSSIYTSLQGGHFLFLVCACFLLPVNLGLEAQKWRLLMLPYYPGLTIKKAYQAVIAGMSLGFITPNRLGEYAGRILYLPEGHRTQAAVATYLSRLGQLVAALIGAFIAIIGFIVSGKVLLQTVTVLIVVCVLLSVLLLTVFILNPHSIKNIAVFVGLLRFKIAQKVTAAQAGFTQTQLVKMIGLACIRYSVFILQYYCLLCAFGYQNSFWLATQVCALIFILKSLVPSVAFSEMGIREGIALQVMGWLFIPATICFNATVTLFVLNLMLPSLIGVFYILKLKTPEIQTTENAVKF